MLATIRSRSSSTCSPPASPTTPRSVRSRPPTEAMSSAPRPRGRSTTRLELVAEDARRHDRRTAHMARCSRRARPGRRDPRSRRMGARCPARSARCRGVRVRGTPERVRRRGGRGAHRQHGGVPDRLRRARDRPGDRRARARSGARATRGCRSGTVATRRLGRALGGLGAVRRSPSGARRRQGIGTGRRPARRRRPPGRGGGQPARHRRRVDRRRRDSADPDRLHQTLVNSLDRKVCNTVNVCCVPRARAAELVPVVVAAIGAAAARRGTDGRLHVETGSVHVRRTRRCSTRRVVVRRADGDHDEPFASPIGAG